MRNRTVLLAVVIGLLVGAGGVGLLVMADDGGGTSLASLPKLPSGGGAERASATMAADSMLAGPVEWRVQGALPTLDDHAVAYRAGTSVSKDAAVQLARALGLSGTPQQHEGTWVLTDGDKQLNVGAQFWSFGPTAVDCPTIKTDPADAVSCGAMPSPPGNASSSSGIAVACAPDGNCPAPPPPVDLPTKDAARAVALRVFDRAGIDASGPVTVFGPGDAWEVAAEPRVDGRRVYGATNNLSVGPKGAILRGGGQLWPTTQVGDYPLVSTAKGLERLKAQDGPVPMGRPEPAVDMAAAAERSTIAVAPAPDQPVPALGPVVRTITGVELGLQPYGSPDGTMFLVPVFLFRIDDGGVASAPAVIDSLLTQAGAGPGPAPEPGGPPQQIAPVPPNSGGGSSSTGSSEACAGAASASQAGGGEPDQPLALEVCASPTNPKVGETVTFSLKANDPDAAVDADGCQQPSAGFGDQPDRSVHCMSICSRDTFPPEATTLTRTFTHAYAKPGTYAAHFTADSCAPKASHGEVSLQITVRG
jgi:hypothetical protein